MSLGRQFVLKSLQLRQIIAEFPPRRLAAQRFGDPLWHSLWNATSPKYNSYFDANHPPHIKLTFRSVSFNFYVPVFSEVPVKFLLHLSYN